MSTNVYSRIFPLIVFLCSSFVLTSCLDIEEEITLHADGTGTYQMKFSMERMMRLYGEFYTQEEFADTMRSRLLQKGETPESLVITMNAKEGVSNAFYRVEGYTVTTGHSFSDIKNARGKLTASMLKAQTGLQTGGYQISPASKKSSWFHYHKKPRPKKEEDKADANSTKDSFEENVFKKALMTSFSSMKVSTIYHLPGKVKKLDNKHAVLSKDKRTVRISASLKEILNDPTVFNVSFRFKHQ